ncbi:dipeptide/oligopeptide/nickel ABC transporter permease/ATP-binding protein [Streptomyces sp. S3(2020)]|uniref:dipeptide/oligopeptide/nickel ABC transporter permease/ATP-binding protein n=1 Tax=Streptomyces sp. S3(2020) TaxID=2732044 RepID=UPI00148772E6|nr:dipeptide/oligopeptide/nickel ABC transporter permease/ATP-binding protein [Streptomyces sp. S3(2020)]NNN30739.1 dipeptide/oligopeptide/nickel ABC transporter permease/ATP-binding protein [Streptomyces sp. S3(2020)]
MLKQRLRALVSSPTRTLATCLVLLLVTLALLGPLLWGGEARTPDPVHLNEAPSAAHPLGTDNLGRDVLARVLTATRPSLVMALTATLIAVVLGALVGALPVLLGRRVQRVFAAVLTTWMAFPVLLIALFTTILLGAGAGTAVLAMGLTMTPVFGRLMQTLTAGIETSDYLVAARMLGISRRRRFLRYVLPNIAEPVLVYVTLNVGGALLALSSLSFLGLGVQAPDFDWGRMLGDALPAVYTSPWTTIAPGAAIVVAGVAFGLAGEAMAGAARSQDTPVRAARTPAPGTAPTTTPPAVPDTSDALLTVENLRVDYPTGSGWTTPVRDVSLRVRPGEIVGVVGESGSGKSVTAMAIARLISSPGAVRAGRLDFDGIDLAALSDKELRTRLGTRVAVVFQDPGTFLNPALRIGVQLTEGLLNQGRTNATTAREKAVHLLRQLRITGAASRLAQYPNELSGGMRQRVLIATAQMAEADLIIADEPTTALDMTVQHHVLETLSKRCREDGSAALVVSHDIGVLTSLCSRIVVMYAGRVVEELSVDTLLKGPAHPYSQALLASLPTLDSPVDQPLETIPGHPPHPDEDITGCAYAARCPRARDTCRNDLPRLEKVSAEGAVACWFPSAPAPATTRSTS